MKPRVTSNLLIRLSLTLFVAGIALSCTANESLLKPQINMASLTYSVEGDFEDVKEDLVMSIESQGAVVSYVAHSSEMLNRTAITLEIKEKVYQKAEIVLFCKAEISHKMVQADPHSLVLCPYPISIYSLNKTPNVIHLTIRKPPIGLPEYDAVHQLLVKVITETLEF